MKMGSSSATPSRDPARSPVGDSSQNNRRDVRYPGGGGSAVPRSGASASGEPGRGAQLVSPTASMETKMGASAAATAWDSDPRFPGAPSPAPRASSGGGGSSGLSSSSFRGSSGGGTAGAAWAEQKIESSYLPTQYADRKSSQSGSHQEEDDDYGPPTESKLGSSYLRAPVAKSAKSASAGSRADYPHLYASSSPAGAVETKMGLPSSSYGRRPGQETKEEKLGAQPSRLASCASDGQGREQRVTWTEEKMESTYLPEAAQQRRDDGWR